MDTDSVMFDTSGDGTWTFLLDDDNCYGHTVLEMGYKKCRNDNSGYENHFGVDSMSEPITCNGELSYRTNNFGVVDV